MRQLNVFCEGQTEQGFCVQVLRPHLFPAGDGIVHTLAVGEKDHRHLYGIGRNVKFERVRKFICNTIKQRQGRNVYFTTLFDLYALPSDFPGKADNVRNTTNPTPYVLALQQAFEQDINYHRFIPHLQLHEYETMLLVEPEAFAISFENCEEAVNRLKEVAASEPSIEHINDGKETAPSKRIINILPEYGGGKKTARRAGHCGVYRRGENPCGMSTLRPMAYSFGKHPMGTGAGGATHSTAAVGKACNLPFAVGDAISDADGRPQACPALTDSAQDPATLPV